MNTFTQDNPSIVLEQVFVIVACGECELEFGMPQTMYKRVRRDGSTWYCPAGHRRCFIGKTEEDRLRDELAFERRRSNRWQNEATHAENRRRAEKAAKTRLKNRIANGVCPCCNRSFTNVRRHITTQHPEFVHEKCEDEQEARDA